MNFDFSQFLQRNEVADQLDHFQVKIAERCRPGRHGDLPSWLAILESLPKATPSVTNFDRDAVQIGAPGDLSPEDQTRLDTGLSALSPWRKGPYQIFDTFIDTEWRSDWKWQRLAPHIQELQGKNVLDIGCGSGYHCWRMLGAGAKQVLGIDPSMRFLIQHLAIQRYACEPRFDFLPLGIEDMPSTWPIFDTVFSMGVLYHRRNPENHIQEISQLLRPGGEVVLETLIIDEAEQGIFRPQGRYAMMRNVWSILTVNKVLELLTQQGFKNARCVDQNITSLEEQRSTEWMRFHSLSDFLQTDDRSKTIEGHPAPKRGIFIAQAGDPN